MVYCIIALFLNSILDFLIKVEFTQLYVKFKQKNNQQTKLTIMFFYLLPYLSDYMTMCCTKLVVFIHLSRQIMAAPWSIKYSPTKVCVCNGSAIRSQQDSLFCKVCRQIWCVNRRPEFAVTASCFLSSSFCAGFSSIL